VLFSVSATPLHAITAPVKTVAAVVVVLSALCLPTVDYAKAPRADEATVNLAELPVQAQRTHQLIYAGGPFPYRKDGAVFGNRERSLPPQQRGFYLEYTVPTPGSRDRGARRIVCGGKQPQAPETCFYTGDHYSTFSRIVQ
jgi:ribonuclease T1